MSDIDRGKLQEKPSPSCSFRNSRVVYNNCKMICNYIYMSIYTHTRAHSYTYIYWITLGNDPKQAKLEKF